MHIGGIARAIDSITVTNPIHSNDGAGHDSVLVMMGTAWPFLWLPGIGHMQGCRPVSVHFGTSFMCDSFIVTTYVMPS